MNKLLVDIHTHRSTDALTIHTVGLHPWHAAEALPAEELFAACDAIGEIGLDRVFGVNFVRQEATFSAQLDLAEQLHKPVVVHCVRAFEEVMQCLRRRTLRAVIFHGFIGSPEQAARAIGRGYYLSFGTRTARSPKTIEALRLTPSERLFVETDDDPAPIKEVYAQIASLREVSVEELQRATHENYLRLFQEQ